MTSRISIPLATCAGAVMAWPRTAGAIVSGEIGGNGGVASDSRDLGVENHAGDYTKGETIPAEGRVALAGEGATLADTAFGLGLPVATLAALWLVRPLFRFARWFVPDGPKERIAPTPYVRPAAISEVPAEPVITDAPEDADGGIADGREAIEPPSEGIIPADILARLMDGDEPAYEKARDYIRRAATVKAAFTFAEWYLENAVGEMTLEESIGVLSDVCHRLGDAEESPAARYAARVVEPLSTGDAFLQLIHGGAVEIPEAMDGDANQGDALDGLVTTVLSEMLTRFSIAELREAIGRQWPASSLSERLLYRAYFVREEEDGITTKDMSVLFHDNTLPTGTRNALVADYVARHYKNCEPRVIADTLEAVRTSISVPLLKRLVLYLIRERADDIAPGEFRWMRNLVIGNGDDADIAFINRCYLDYVRLGAELLSAGDVALIVSEASDKISDQIIEAYFDSDDVEIDEDDARTLWPVARGEELRRRLKELF